MRSVVVHCPYCRHPLQLRVFSDIRELGMSSEAAIVRNDYLQAGELKPVLCYPEEGGCDRYFVVRVDLEPAVTVYELQEKGIFDGESGYHV